MLHFLDVYLQTTKKYPLRVLHELEHRIFLIPDLANIYNDTQSKTNGMAYSRGIRFSLTSNNANDIAQFKKFFQKIHNYNLPEWTDAERERFEAEEKEWQIRQRQYFWSFALHLFENEFDAINGIWLQKLEKNCLKNIFSWVRICEDFSLSEWKKFEKNSWRFPQIEHHIPWNEEGNMVALIFPEIFENYAFFALALEWIGQFLREQLQYSGKIYDLDAFNAYECDYILGVIYWYQRENFAKSVFKNFFTIPTESEFENLKRKLIFATDEQVAFHDQEANVVMGFSPQQEKEWVQNANYADFLEFYPNFVKNFSLITKNS